MKSTVVINGNRYRASDIRIVGGITYDKELWNLEKDQPIYTKEQFRSERQKNCEKLRSEIIDLIQSVPYKFEINTEKMVHFDLIQRGGFFRSEYWKVTLDQEIFWESKIHRIVRVICEIDSLTSQLPNSVINDLESIYAANDHDPNWTKSHGASILMRAILDDYQVRREACNDSVWVFTDRNQRYYHVEDTALSTEWTTALKDRSVSVCFTILKLSDLNKTLKMLHEKLLPFISDAPLYSEKEFEESYDEKWWISSGAPRFDVIMYDGEVKNVHWSDVGSYQDLLNIHTEISNAFDASASIHPPSQI